MPRKKRAENKGDPVSFRLSAAALAALDQLSLALDQPKTKVIELALAHLEEDWRAGRIKGVTLLVAAEAIDA